MENVAPRTRAALAAAFCGLLLAGSLLAGFPASAADNPRPLVSLVQVQNGTTEGLGGGDYLLVKAGQAAFGVVYGSPDHPEGSVTFLAVVVRSLGTADVRDESNGKLLKDNVTLPVGTIVAQRLDLAVEFRDMDGDGIFDYQPDLTAERSINFTLHADPVVKAARLAGDWNLTAFSLEAVSDDQVDISFTLALVDVPYARIIEAGAPLGDGKLNRIAFTVHLTILRERVHADDIPHFVATVGRDGNRRVLTSLEPAGTVSANFTTLTGRFKIDHDIVGWDFAPPRGEVESALLLGTTMLFLSAVDQRLAPWLTDRAMEGPREGTANATTTDNRSVQMDPSRPADNFTRARQVSLNDEWMRIGRLTWMSTVDVWANASSAEPHHDEVRFQVLGGARFAGIWEGKAFRGFVLVGGYIYPSGYRLYHDPLMEAQSVEVEPSTLPGVLPAIILLAEFVFIVGGILAVVVFVAKSSTAAARTRKQAEAQRFGDLRSRYRLPEAPLQPPRRGV